MNSTLPHSVQLDAPAGSFLGSEEAGVRTFRTIPYAQAPVGRGRFARPQPISESMTYDTRQPGCVAPQSPSRLEAVMGSYEASQSEDCLTLAVYAPASIQQPLPVMVWLHGGAYLSGGGAIDCYAADQLVRLGNVIVVSPNFRLGALGLLYLPPISEGNLAQQDIIAALHWVHKNIAAFGGDSQTVTLFGQSSGASLIRSLMSMPAARGLFKRAILQSPPLGRVDRSIKRGRDIGEQFAALLSLASTDVQGFQKIPASQLVAAQGPLARSLSMPLGMTELPFVPVVDHREVLPDYSGNWFASEPGHQMMIGYTAQEMTAFHLGNPVLNQISMKDVALSLTEWAGSAVCTAFMSQRTDQTPQQIISEFYTEYLFGVPSREYAHSMAKRGVSTWVYRFDKAVHPDLRACHCLELPFIFNNFERWTNARMLQGPAEDLAPLAEKMALTWTHFAHTGNPGEAFGHWHALGARSDILVIDSVSRTEAMPESTD